MAEYGDDPELIEAILASKQAEVAASITVPEEPPADLDENLVCTIRLRCPDGS